MEPVAAAAASVPTMRIRVLCPSLRLSLVGERCRSAPFGMFGGLPPEPLANGLWNQLTFHLVDGRSGTAVDLFGRSSPSKWGAIELHEGDEFEYVTIGGGGYGPPAERAPSAISEDIELQVRVGRARRPRVRSDAGEVGLEMSDRSPRCPLCGRLAVILTDGVLLGALPFAGRAGYVSPTHSTAALAAAGDRRGGAGVRHG